MSDLVNAVKNGDSKRVHELVQQGQNVNWDPDEQGSPLHWAVCMGHMEITNILIQHGALVNRTTPWGMTPLHVAADMGHTQCICLLLSSGAKIDAQSDHKDTPLHAAAQRGYLEACRILLQYGASISVKNKRGKTPVEEAKGQGHSQVASLLITHGRVDGKNNTDKLPIGRHRIQPEKTGFNTAPFCLEQSFNEPAKMRPLSVGASDSNYMDSLAHGRSVMEKKLGTNDVERSSLKHHENHLSKVNSKGNVMTCNIFTDDGHIEKKVLNIPAPSATASPSLPKDLPLTKITSSESSRNGENDVSRDMPVTKQPNEHKSSRKISLHGAQPVPESGKRISSEQSLHNQDNGLNISVEQKSPDGLGKVVPQQSKKETDFHHHIMLLVKQRTMLEEYIEKLQIELTKRQDKIDSLRGQAVYSQYTSVLDELARTKQELQGNQAKVAMHEEELRKCQKRLEVELARSRHLARQLFDLRKRLDENPTLYKCLMMAQVSRTVNKGPTLLENKLNLAENVDGTRRSRGVSSASGSGHGGRFVGRGLDSPEPSSPPPRPGSSLGASGQLAPDLLAAQFAAMGLGGQWTHENLYTALLPVFQSTGGDLLGVMMHSLRKKVTETLKWDQSILESCGKEWQLGEDFFVLDDKPLPESSEKSAVLLRIIHSDSLYILKVMLHMKDIAPKGASPQSPPHTSSTSHDSVLLAPTHRNITRILHQYVGPMKPFNHLMPQIEMSTLKYPGKEGATAYPEGQAIFCVTEAYSMTLRQFITEYHKVNPVPPYGLPIKFIHQMIFEVLSSVCHLEKYGIVHGDINAGNVFLDCQMQTVLGGINFEKRIVDATIANRKSEEATFDISGILAAGKDCEKFCIMVQSHKDHSSHVDSYEAARMMCSMFQPQTEPEHSDDNVPCVPACFPVLLRHVMTSLLRQPREARITTRQAKVRVGIGLFGPDYDEVTDLRQCEVWLQAKMMKLLVQPPSCSRHLPGGTISSVDLAVELNNDWLERDFVTMVTAEELWEQYKAVRDYISK